MSLVKVLKAGLIWLLLIVIVLFCLAPFFWILSSSLKPTEEIFSAVPRWIPSKLTFEHYAWIFSKSGGNLGRFLLNSLVASSLSAVVITLVSALGGYSLGRFEFPGRQVLGVLILILQMIQGPLVIVFWYRFAWKLGILDTYIALIIAYMAINLPFAIWLSAGFFSQLPKELEDAALVDGANYWRLFWRIIFPIAVPGIVSIAVYAFVMAWNDYLFALILTQTERSKTIQIALFDLLSFFAKSNWGGLMAGGVITSLPPVLLYMYLQKYVVSGLSVGAVKE